jgi:NtrC-family two-component system sensor histidine kinase KinB
MDVILGEPEWFRQFVERATCGEIVRYEFTANMDGTTRHFEARVEQIPFSFGSALQWAAHDMSALRELDHWREELTDIIVHNLRNPLTWVKSGVGMAQLLLQQTRDPDVDAALANAEKGIARLEQQIDILLNIGRAEAGHDLTDRQPLSVTDVIQEVRELLGPRAAARRITLRTELNASLPKIDGNRNMLTWALQNLVDNAIKFSPTQAVVTIQALLEAGETETTGDRLRINVIDQGPGVPKADRQRVFQKFYQSNRPQGAKGVGLGLYFCRLAIEAHGGRIWIVDANDEPGATFCFTLPV